MESDPAESLDLARVVGDCLAVRVRLINRVVSAIYDEALRPHGLRISQANLLVAIAHQGSVRPVDLCRLIRIEKSTLSRDVEILKRQGWVETDPPAGGRNQVVRLTPEGRDLVRAIFPAWEQAQARARECLGDDGAEQVRALARRLGLG